MTTASPAAIHFLIPFIILLSFLFPVTRFGGLCVWLTSCLPKRCTLIRSSARPAEIRPAETVTRLGILYDDSDLLIDYLYHIILSSSIFFHIFLYKIASGWLKNRIRVVLYSKCQKACTQRTHASELQSSLLIMVRMVTAPRQSKSQNTSHPRDYTVLSRCRNSSDCDTASSPDHAVFSSIQRLTSAVISSRSRAVFSFSL